MRIILFLALAFTAMVCHAQDSQIQKENVIRMIALNYDRYLLFSFNYQKFGTQFLFDEQTNEMLLAPIDKTPSNDEERAKYKVEPLNELLKKHKMKPMPKRTQ